MVGRVARGRNGRRVVVVATAATETWLFWVKSVSAVVGGACGDEATSSSSSVDDAEEDWTRFRFLSTAVPKLKPPRLPVPNAKLCCGTLVKPKGKTPVVVNTGFGVLKVLTDAEDAVLETGRDVEARNTPGVTREDGVWNGEAVVERNSPRVTRGEVRADDEAVVAAGD